jgi:hypothetical protein
MARYTFREITAKDEIVGYAVERVEGEIGAFTKIVIRTFTVGKGKPSGIDRRSPELISAYHCAKSMSEALNG